VSIAAVCQGISGRASRAPTERAGEVQTSTWEVKPGTCEAQPDTCEVQPDTPAERVSVYGGRNLTAASNFPCLASHVNLLMK